MLAIVIVNREGSVVPILLLGKLRLRLPHVPDPEFEPVFF